MGITALKSWPAISRFFRQGPSRRKLPWRQVELEGMTGMTPLEKLLLEGAHDDGVTPEANRHGIARARW
ncbi:MAG: hypothetical protein R3C60_09575 [Parvularculaceae bacterium]